MTDEVRRLEARLYRDVKATCEGYQLLAPGDRIMVAMSGGKDSYTPVSYTHLTLPTKA